MSDIKTRNQGVLIGIGRKDLTEQVIKLLKKYSAESKSAIAIAIDGEWGVGKSYMYREYLASEIQKETRKKPIYTSVFGKKDENEIVQDLVIQLITQEKESTKEKASISNWIINPIITALSQGTIRSIDTSFIFRAFEKKDLKNSIICIDDFERLSSKIPIEDVLGLISELKENKGCHIILLCNENMIDEAHKAKFKEYREKIIDRSFSYKPDPIEQFDLIRELLWEYSDKDEQYFSEYELENLLCNYEAKYGVLALNSINLREIKKVIHCFNDYCDGLEENLTLKDTHTRILFTNAILWFLFCYTKVRPLERELERLALEKDELEKKKQNLEKTNITSNATNNAIRELNASINKQQSNIDVLEKRITEKVKSLGYTKPQVPFFDLIVNSEMPMCNLNYLFQEYDKNNVFTFRKDQKAFSKAYLNNETTFISILQEFARQYRFQKEYGKSLANQQDTLKASEKFFNEHKDKSSSVWFMLNYCPRNWNPLLFTEAKFNSSFIDNDPKYKEKIQELVQEALTEAKSKESTNHWLNRYRGEVDEFLKQKGF